MSECKVYEPVTMGGAFPPTWYKFEAPRKNGVVLLANPSDMPTARLLCQSETDLELFSKLGEDHEAVVRADPDDNESRSVVKVFRNVEEGAVIAGSMVHVRAHLAAERGLPQMAAPNRAWNIRMPALRGVFLPNEVKANKKPVAASDGNQEFHPLWVMEEAPHGRAHDIEPLLGWWHHLPSERDYSQLFKATGEYYGDGAGGEVAQIIADMAPPAVRLERLPQGLRRGSLVVANCVERP